MGNIKQINIKNCTYYFLKTWLILKTLIQADQKWTKKYTKTFIFITSDTSQ